MENYYKMKISGLERNLPLCPVSEKMDIAAFIMLGDVEITIAAANALAKKVPDADIILTAECKGIPLAYEMAKIMGIKYVVARKKTKLYMTDPISVDVKSITTDGIQKLYLDCKESEAMNGKKILIVDDVISTGDSLMALEKLCEISGGIIAGKAAVLAEGSASDRDDIIFLEKLPLFFKD